MAERRMFAKSIVLSDEFLDMTAEARSLYMTMGMMADDDGFVNNTRSIVRLTGVSMDNLQELIDKKFILMFEDGVAVIKHWKINNYIRNDRYQSTNYIEDKELLDIDENNAYTLSKKDGIPGGIPNSGIPRLGKDRLGKDSIGYTSSSTPSSDEEAEAVAEDFNQTCKDLPRPIRMTPKRKKKVDSILKRYTPDDVHKVFCKVQENEYLKKKNTGWLTFDWIFKDDHFDRIIEGNYDNQHKEFIPGELGDVVKKLMEGG